MAPIDVNAYVYIAGREVGHLRREGSFDLTFDYVDGYDATTLSVP